MPKATAFNPVRLATVAIPDGKYPGAWVGYRVEFFCEGVRHEADTSVGIRTPSATCIVTATNGALTVETI